MISNKAKQFPVGQDNKYSTSLKDLSNITDINDVINILNKNGIEFKNNKIMGGRTTRKNKKQSGGFTYKSSSKRKTISSVKSLRKTSRRSSR
jgi:hypothetical protein